MTKLKRPSAKAYAETVKAYKKQISELQDEIASERCRRMTAQAEEIKVRQQLKTAGDLRDSALNATVAVEKELRETTAVVMAMLKQIYLPAPQPLNPGTINNPWTRTEKGDKNE